MVQKTDDEQLEDIKRWWEKNGKYLVVLLVAVISTVVGTRAWQDYTNTKSESASAAFDQVVQAVQSEQLEDMRNKAGEVIEKHADTQYAVLSALSLAKSEVEKGELDSAFQRLDWALSATTDEMLLHVIRLRLARVQIAQDKQDMALQTISGIEAPGKFAPLYAVVRGDAYYAKGDKSAARTAYQEAASSSDLPQQVRSLVQMKLDDLGGGAQG